MLKPTQALGGESYMQELEKLLTNIAFWCISEKNMIC